MGDGGAPPRSTLTPTPSCLRNCRTAASNALVPPRCCRRVLRLRGLARRRVLSRIRLFWSRAFLTRCVGILVSPNRKTDHHLAVVKHIPKKVDKPYRPYRDALNGILALGAICMMVYGLTALGRKSLHTRWRWFAIDLMVQVISIKLASDLVTHGISTPGQNQNGRSSGGDADCFHRSHSGL